MQIIAEPDFIVVIRSANERTKESCKYIVSNELPDDFIHVIELTPFEEAVRECYRIGIESNKKWMVTIDADVLPILGFLSKVKQYTERVSKNVIMFNLIIHDKLLLKYRSGGIKVYRTKYLTEALGYIPANGTTLRPEATTLKKMVDLGFKKKNFPDVIGLHDYEQFFQDIYRKSFFHAAKHTKEIGELLMQWKELSENDADYKVAIKGAVDGLLTSDGAKPDVRMFTEQSMNSIYSKLSLNEKRKIESKNVTQIVKNIINDLEPFQKKYDLENIKTEVQTKGILKGTGWLIGSVLEDIGKKLK